MKTRYWLSVIVLISLLFVSGTASARPLNAALGTGFTYQGKLTDGGAPADGTYDFEFSLYNALSGGSQVGSSLPQSGIVVADGLFTAQLDFGNVFDGTALFLSIGVKPGGSAGVYTTLTPRQALTATPYAIYASAAPWLGLTGVPAGFADGVDDGSVYTAGTGLSLAGTQFNVTGAPWSGLSGVPSGFADGVDNGSAYQNIKVVAQSGGDFTTITAALDSISDASASNHYLVYVAPGVYTERVTMKQHVDIEGAGELVTKITFTGNASSFGTGTLLGASNAELRFLTVENTGDGNTFAIAIYDGSASPRLTHVTASASGGTENYGVRNFSSSPTMTNVTASASGGNFNYGVYNESLSSPTMTNVTARVSGGSADIGVYNRSSSATINNSIISASGGSSSNYGILNFAVGSSYTVLVNNSQISGSTSAVSNDAEFTTRIGASQLSGGAVINSGTATCAGVYDENYVFSAGPVCP